MGKIKRTIAKIEKKLKKLMHGEKVQKNQEAIELTAQINKLMQENASEKDSLEKEANNTNLDLQTYADFPEDESFVLPSIEELESITNSLVFCPNASLDGGDDEYTNEDSESCIKDSSTDGYTQNIDATCSAHENADYINSPNIGVCGVNDNNIYHEVCD